MTRPVALVFTLLALATVCGHAQTSADLVRTGTAAFDKGDYDGAIVAFDGVITIDPKSEEAYYYLGQSFLAKKEPALAEGDFTTAIALDPNNADAYDGRGAAYDLEGNYTGAIADYTEALRLHPSLVEAQRRLNIDQRKADLARKYPDHEQEQPKPAPKEADNAPPSPTAAETARENQAEDMVGKGITADQKGDSNGAIADYTEAIQIDPTYVLGYFNRASAYALKNEYQKATSDWNHVIQLHPRFATGYCYRSVNYLNAGNMKEALADADHAVHLNPDSTQPFYFRGLVYFDMADFDKAIADFSQSLNPDPKVADALRDPSLNAEISLPNSACVETTDRETNLWRGDAYLNRGIRNKSTADFDKAIADFTEEIRQMPNEPGPYIDRATAYHRKGDQAHALADLNKMASLGPGCAKPCNEEAWRFATSSRADVRDGKWSLEMATLLCHLTNWKDNDLIETFAAASAEVGDFDSAIKWQMVYLETPNLDPKYAAEGRTCLALYQVHKPFHHPKTAEPKGHLY